tara:strand:+ start:8353 stop:8703 length:351 start_codon:yes stop_codon:yes gene_type:complete
MGIVVDRLHEGEAELSLQLEDHHRNFFGMVHGGVLLTLLDQSCGAALRSTRPARSPQGSVTIHLQSVFVAPARGDRIVARGRCLRLGRSIAQCTAAVEDAEGRLAATATGTFKLLG